MPTIEHLTEKPPFYWEEGLEEEGAGHLLRQLQLQQGQQEPAGLVSDALLRGASHADQPQYRRGATEKIPPIRKMKCAPAPLDNDLIPEQGGGPAARHARDASHYHLTTRSVSGWNGAAS